MDKIICTQDVEGERAWLESQFPQHQNLQTEFGALWPNQRLEPGTNNFLWEIPPDSEIDLYTIEFEKIFSLYGSNTNYVDHRWCCTDQLVTNLDFRAGKKSPWAQVISFGRCGTVFLEKLLYDHLGYQKLSGHQSLASEERKVLIDRIEIQQPDVFMIYRKDWWEWTSSFLIAETMAFVDEQGQERWPHSADGIDWSQVDPIYIDPTQLQRLHNYALSNWNAYCHLRSRFVGLNFYVLEFSDLIKVQKPNLDNKIIYNKSNLIKNYRELQNIFEQQYLPLFQKYQKNALAHLRTMKCHMSIDHLVV